jgi:hypothetical protein
MFGLSVTERLLEFHKIRNSIENIELQEQILTIVALWEKAPQCNQYYSADFTENWPDPWQLLADGVYDPVSVGLGMFYTLALLQHKQYNTLKLLSIRERDSNELKLIVQVDELLLNLVSGEVIESKAATPNIIVCNEYTPSYFSCLTH